MCVPFSLPINLPPPHRPFKGTTHIPLVYTEDPLLPPPGVEFSEMGKPGDVARRSPLTTTAGSGRFSKVAAGSKGSRQEPSAHFTADHIKNLAEVAGSKTLEVGLRRAAAEQLRAVLESRGVASVVSAAATSGSGVREENEASSEVKEI